MLLAVSASKVNVVKSENDISDDAVLGVWGSAVSSPSGVWGEAPADKGFCAYLGQNEQLWWQQKLQFPDFP